MKITSFAVCLSTMAAVTLGGHADVCRAASVPAAPAGASYSSQPFLLQNVTWEEYKIEQLRHAYHLLDHTDRDYDGHRKEAMHSIRKAAEILGVELKGGLHAGESQWDSDHKMREAKRILEGLIDETHGAEQAHIHRAIKELDKGLAIR